MAGLTWVVAGSIIIRLDDNKTIISNKVTLSFMIKNRYVADLKMLQIISIKLRNDLVCSYLVLRCGRVYFGPRLFCQIAS